MEKIEDICVNQMGRIMDNFIKNYPFVYIDDAIEAMKWQEHELLCKIDYSQANVKGIIQNCLDKEDDMILAMVRYNDRDKYSGKTFVEVSNYALNRALQADKLHLFGLLSREELSVIFDECLKVILECREHTFNIYDIMRVEKSLGIIKELVEWQ